MGFGAGTKGTHRVPGTAPLGFRSTTEEGREVAADGEGDARGTGPLPGETLRQSALLGSEAQALAA